MCEASTLVKHLWNGQNTTLPPIKLIWTLCHYESILFLIMWTASIFCYYPYNTMRTRGQEMLVFRKILQTYCSCKLKDFVKTGNFLQTVRFRVTGEPCQIYCHQLYLKFAVKLILKYSTLGTSSCEIWLGFNHRIKRTHS